jgi:glycosyltransferase involved in cell wall biosynthesis
VSFHQDLEVAITRREWAVFSWPPHYEQIARRLAPEVPHERVIHLVQNVRHANPEFTAGYALRLLARPLARIMVAEEVTEACRPYLNHESATATIVEGHNWEFFALWREGGLGTPIRVGYTTWKSEVGVEVEAELAAEGFQFRSLRRTATWEEIRELLHWCDVFLGCPGPEEGFYLPGLEALAAGAVLIIPDVGGNRAYCRFDENCVRVAFEDSDSYVKALRDMAGWGPERVARMRRVGYDILDSHTLARERAEFGRFLTQLSGRQPKAWNGGLQQP